ncbi:hypothetical protein JW859_01320 [bacterium]|nr:hypothetical protein [bacterium]
MSNYAMRTTLIATAILLTGQLLLASSCSAALAIWAIDELRETSRVTWTGTVTDGRIGSVEQKLQQAQVTLVYATTIEQETPREFSAFTDEDGKFSLTFDWQADTKCSVAIRYDQQVAWPADYYEVYQPKSDRQLELSFEPFAVGDSPFVDIQGTLTNDAVPPVALADVTVLVHYAIELEHVSLAFGDLSDEFGKYSVRAPFNRSALYSIQLIRHGRAVEPQQPEDLTTIIRGHMTDNGLGEDFACPLDLEYVEDTEPLADTLIWNGCVEDQAHLALGGAIIVVTMEANPSDGTPLLKQFAAEAKENGDYTISMDWLPIALYSVMVIHDGQAYEPADLQRLLPQVGVWNESEPNELTESRDLLIDTEDSDADGDGGGNSGENDSAST